MKRFCWPMESPIGPLTLWEDEKHLTRLMFGRPEAGEACIQETPLMKEAKAQLNAYFAGELQHFDLPLAPKGTAFQKACWRALLEIPYGQTRSYVQQAAAIGNPKATRAVGMANHRNPLPILIPCHRVVGKAGQLTGYAGGLANKAYLLDLELSAAADNRRKL